jgi:hydrogenase maturation protein HypF
VNAVEPLTAVRERREIAVRGIVQGVGFRPFIHTLARRHGLAGWVRNDAEGVRIAVEGAAADLDRFLGQITADAPPLAVVESVAWQPARVRGENAFRIEKSRDGANRRALVSPDVATCAACLSELFDPNDRRYRYPFLNCTNCGPRFTITRAVPYDRAATTMSGFRMCAACRREYDDPADRRFHAQPNACPACGPRVRLLDRSGCTLPADDAIWKAAGLLRRGAVVAVKGLGGYHLACDPFDAAAVGALRNRKVRQDKPFALMARDANEVRALCRVGPDEEALLTSPARPIVLLTRRDDTDFARGVAAGVAPHQRTLGVMLAYTPLHHLLLRDAGTALVMTSGNRSDEPIAYRDEDALARLGDIADYFLIHDRPIHMRCDDSVAACSPFVLFRRSRGYAPTPLRVASGFRRHALACGGELKNTFCLARESHAFLSHHIGDMENYETLRSFREGVEHYCRLFDVNPEVVAYYLHPEYLSTKYAREREDEGLPTVGVQHHHAHVAACLADNERPGDERVIGVALDGTGYGIDGAIWGGEFFDGSIAEGFSRRAHLEYVPLPGGEAAIRQPWRMALAHLLTLYGEEDALALPLPLVRCAGARNIQLVARLMASGLNSPPTSSAGRLFDAVAALIGVPGSGRVTYEGQAAVELEIAAGGPAADGYPVRFRTEGDGWVVETGGIIAAVVEDVMAGRTLGEISSRFHRTMAEAVTRVCERVREASGVTAVALSGGTFQNRLLLGQATELLADRGFVVYRHRRVPPNDGGLSLGQAVLADAAGV